MQKWVFFSGLFLLNVFILSAQPSVVCKSECSGNLGENIFPDGDFGSGTPNVLPGNPGIAPGYSYTTFPPPNDGSYTITNNTSSWGSFAVDNWINIQDNGPEANGYMMVVNAAFSPGLFYSKEVNVCANTLYEMSVDVISLIESSVAASSIKSNVAFLINGADVCATGDISHDEAWHTHRFSFTTGPNDNTVTLSFRNNAPGGYGNDIAIDNISFRACGPLIAVTDTVAFCSDGTLNLAANIQNSPYNTPFYQWQVFRPALGWINVPGASAVNLSLSTAQNGDLYRLVTANAALNITLPYCRSVSFPVTAVLEDLSNFAIGGTDTIVCNGAPGILEAGPFAKYQWSTGAVTPEIATDTPGWYAVTVTSANACTASDSLLVYEVDLSVDSDFKNPVCFGDSTGEVRVFNRMGGVGSLSYALEGRVPVAQPFIEAIPSGNFTILVKDSLGCTVRMPVALTDPPQLTVDIGGNRTITACDTVAFHAVSNKTTIRYVWTPADSLDCADCPGPVAMPLLDMPVTVEISDELGCKASDSVWIKVLPRLEVFAPNIIVLDGLSEGSENSFFTIFTGKSAVLVNRLEICDRWGDLVFSRKGSLPGDMGLRWYGFSASGKPVSEGVYVWYAEIVFSDGVARVFKGDVMVAR
jgi:hypothetical protein